MKHTCDVMASSSLYSHFPRDLEIEYSRTNTGKFVYNLFVIQETTPTFCSLIWYSSWKRDYKSEKGNLFPDSRSLEVGTILFELKFPLDWYFRCRFTKRRLRFPRNSGQRVAGSE
jgi:hypothetical protein